MRSFQDLVQTVFALFRAAPQTADKKHRDAIDDADRQKVAHMWVKASTPEEKAAALTEVRRYVLDGSDGSSTLADALGDTNFSSDLEWSHDPGAYEAQLKRRFDNPYFSPLRRVISQQELSAAKQIDCEDFEKVKVRFLEILFEVDTLPEIAAILKLHALRESIDDFVYFAMGVGGPAKILVHKADELRGRIISNMQDAFSDDLETLEAIEKADSYHRDEVNKFNCEFSSQLARDDSPIAEDEVLPSLLSEDSMTISIVIDTLPEESRDQIKLAAMLLIRNALNDGYRDPEFEEKVAVLSS